MNKLKGVTVMLSAELNKYQLIEEGGEHSEHEYQHGEHEYQQSDHGYQHSDHKYQQSDHEHQPSLHKYHLKEGEVEHGGHKDGEGLRGRDEVEEDIIWFQP